MQQIPGNKNVIVDIPFNIDLTSYMLPRNYIHIKLRQSFLQAQTKEWIERRMQLFMNYTANSLKHQTSQDFLCLVRYTSNTQDLIKEALKKYEQLPGNIRFTDDAQSIIDASIEKYKNLYRVVIDSDNMYHNSFMEKLHQFEVGPLTKTILCQGGYVYDDQTGDVMSIFHQAPSFYAAVYDEATYEQLYSKRLFEKHWDVLSYPYEVMAGKNYCICTHDINVDNTFINLRRGYRGQVIEGEAKNAFFREWHIDRGAYKQ